MGCAQRLPRRQVSMMMDGWMDDDFDDDDAGGGVVMMSTIPEMKVKA